jgi:hypothetical protein
MANEEHLAILRQGVEVWNRWRGENPDVRSDLIGVDLSGANLGLADLNGSNLEGVNLSKATLVGTSLETAKLNAANLTSAHLGMTDLAGSDLTKADLTDAILMLTNLRGVNLSGADLTKAKIVNIVLADVDLSEVRGLPTVEHLGPSHISTDTLVKSKGKIPESFLRGCGVPESMIAYLPSILGAMEPIQFYSCFISYSTKDQDFAQRLYEPMQSHKLRVWFAPEDMKGGQKFNEQIDQAIRVHDKLILILSEHSLRSKWVMTEVRRTRRADGEQPPQVLPDPVSGYEGARQLGVP